MTDLKQWIDNRGLKGQEYLGDLCRNNHEYLNTGKSIRCKPTNRPNGKCLCCRKRMADKNYKTNKQYYLTKAKKWHCSEKGFEYANSQRCKDLRNKYKEKKRRENKCELRENITLWTAIKNAGAPTPVDLVREQIKNNKVFDFKKYQRLKYKTNFEFNLYVKLKRGMQKAKNLGLPYEKIDVKKIINKIYSYKQCCAYCGIRLNLMTAKLDNSLEMDHVISFSNGGSHTFNNLIPSCKKCNHSKKSNNLEDWYKEQIFYKKENLEKIKK